MQILGDQHGNVFICTSAIARCSGGIKRSSRLRPSVDLDERVRKELCDAAVKIAQRDQLRQRGHGGISLDLDTNEWFFIEMNPRIQVEHTVTEVITGIDLVRSQILIAQGTPLHGPGTRLAAAGRNSAQWLTPCNAASRPKTRKINSRRITGSILTYRSAAVLASGWTAAWATRAAVITPFYDSLLVKVTASGRDFRHGACNAWTARCASSASAA